MNTLLYQQGRSSLKIKALSSLDILHRGYRASLDILHRGYRVDANQPPFIIEMTDIGVMEREKRVRGEKPKRNAGELAIMDFMSSENGLRRYVSPGDPVALLFEDGDWRVYRKPPNLHVLSTVGMLRGLERVGVIKSADAILYEMTHPSMPDRRISDARVLTDIPDGTDLPAAIGSEWEPPSPF